MNAAAKCPNCRTVIPSNDGAIKSANRMIGDMREKIAELENRLSRINEQDEAKRAELMNRAQRAEVDAKEARKEANAARADLKSMHDALTGWLTRLGYEALNAAAVRSMFQGISKANAAARDQAEIDGSNGRVQRCTACDYVGELVGDHAEYCGRCGENVLAMLEALRADRADASFATLIDHPEIKPA